MTGREWEREPADATLESRKAAELLYASQQASLWTERRQSLSRWFVEQGRGYSDSTVNVILSGGRTTESFDVFGFRRWLEAEELTHDELRLMLMLATAFEHAPEDHPYHADVEDIDDGYLGPHRRYHTGAGYASAKVALRPMPLKEESNG